MFLKRSFYSLRHRWWQNLLLILLFASLFAVAIGSLTLYGTTKAQSDHLQKALGNAVTLKGLSVSLRDNYSARGGQQDISKEEITAFLDSPLAEDYNYLDFSFLSLVDAKGVYEKEFPDVKDYSFFRKYAVHSYGVLDSSLDAAFNLYGYRLIDGEHITKDRVNDNICLVSRQFAELNSFHVGDSFDVRYAIDPNNPAVSLQIIGIVEPPECDYGRLGLGSRPEEIIITTPGANYSVSGRDESRPDLLYTHNGSPRVTVYLDSPEEAEAFVAQAKEKLPIRTVVDSYYDHPRDEPAPEETAGMMDYMDVFDYMDEHKQYDLFLDREWYDRVGAPLEKSRNLAGGIAVFLLAAVLLVLVLTMVLMLSGRKREIGILLSMGEGKGKIAAQLALEALVPLCIAMAVGLPLGRAVSAPVIEYLCSGVYQQSADLTQQENDLIRQAALAQDQVATTVEMSEFSSALLGNEPGRVVTYPQAEPKLDAWSLGAYLILVLAASLLAVGIQAGAVFRLKPAQILTGKGE